MKRTLIALGVAATVALPVAAQAAPTVYGKLMGAVEQYKQDFDNPASTDVEITRLQNWNSRIGVKGEDALTDSLKVIYTAEWAVALDTAGGASDLVARNRFLGLKSDFGTLKMGAYDSYLKQAQGKVDLFNDIFGDMAYVIAGENRLSNVVGYESPVFAGGLQVNVLGQTRDNAAGNGPNTANGSSASVVYNNSDLGLFASAAMDKGLVSATALNGSRESDNMRAVVVYNIADLSLGAVYNTSKASSGASNKETGILGSVAYTLGKEVLKLQYGQAEADDNTASVQKHTLLDVGVDHNFTKQTRAFVFYTERKEDQLAALNNGNKETAYGIGMEHNF